MIILAFLQNQWFKPIDADSVERVYARYPDRRNELIARYLFMGCLTGRRLMTALRPDLTSRIIWEETSKNIGRHSGAVFPADLEHMKAAVEKFQPDVVICFGAIACNAISHFYVKAYVYEAPHPASRQNPMPDLMKLAEWLRERIKNERA